MPSERVSMDITASSIFRSLLILIGFWFLYLIADILLMLFAAIVIAAAVEPLVNWAQRYRVPRALSAALVYIVVIAVLLGTLSLLIEPLGEQTRQLAAAVPQLMERLAAFTVLVPDFDQTAMTDSLQNSLGQLGENLTRVSVNVFQQTRTFFSGIVSVLFVFVLAFYLVLERDALKKFARLVTPHQHLPYVERAITRAQRSIGRWVLAQLTLALIVGTLVGVTMWIIGIRYALLLGLLAGMLEIIPVIGPIVAGIPGVIIGLSQSVTFGIIALAVYIVVQQIEGQLLIPTIMRRAIGLNPLVTIIAILLGARIAGVAGIILSVPMATIISVFLSDLFAPPEPSDELAG